MLDIRTPALLRILLMYLGCMPFLLCLLLIALNITTIPILGHTTTTLSIYGIIIATFMFGAHWGQHFTCPRLWSIYLIVSSNMMTIILWLAFLNLTAQWLWITLTIAFVILIITDHMLAQAGIISRNYLHTRYMATTIVIISLLLASYLSW